MSDFLLACQMDTEVQARSESTGISTYRTVREAVKAAEKDPSIWKISFNGANGERIRLIRIENQNIPWSYEPLLMED